MSDSVTAQRVGTIPAKVTMDSSVVLDVCGMLLAIGLLVEDDWPKFTDRVWREVDTLRQAAFGLLEDEHPLWLEQDRLETVHHEELYELGPKAADETLRRLASGIAEMKDDLEAMCSRLEPAV